MGLFTSCQRICERLWPPLRKREQLGKVLRRYRVTSGFVGTLPSNNLTLELTTSSELSRSCRKGSVVRAVGTAVLTGQTKKSVRRSSGCWVKKQNLSSSKIERLKVLRWRQAELRLVAQIFTGNAECERRQNDKNRREQKPDQHDTKSGIRLVWPRARYDNQYAKNPKNNWRIGKNSGGQFLHACSIAKQIDLNGERRQRSGQLRNKRCPRYN